MATDAPILQLGNDACHEMIATWQEEASAPSLTRLDWRKRGDTDWTTAAPNEIVSPNDLTSPSWTANNCQMVHVEGAVYKLTETTSTQVVKSLRTNLPMPGGRKTLSVDLKADERTEAQLTFGLNGVTNRIVVIVDLTDGTSSVVNIGIGWSGYAGG